MYAAKSTCHSTSQGRTAGGSAVARVTIPHIHRLATPIPGLLESIPWLSVFSGCF
jgi:hypothetical protein